MELQLFFRYLCAKPDFHWKFCLQLLYRPWMEVLLPLDCLPLSPPMALRGPNVAWFEGLSCSQHDSGDVFVWCFGMEAITIHGMVYLPTFDRVEK